MSDAAEIAALEVAFPRAQRWSEAAWREELQGSDRFIDVDREGGIVAVAAWHHLAEMAELRRIIVAPEHRGQGRARELMARGLAWARRRGAERVLLEVEETNGPAIRLYRSEGFVPISRRTDYYGPGAHALVLEYNLELS